VWNLFCFSHHIYRDQSFVMFVHPASQIIINDDGGGGGGGDSHNDPRVPNTPQNA